MKIRLISHTVIWFQTQSLYLLWYMYWIVLWLYCSFNFILLLYFSNIFVLLSGIKGKPRVIGLPPLIVETRGKGFWVKSKPPLVETSRRACTGFFQKHNYTNVSLSLLGFYLKQCVTSYLWLFLFFLLYQFRMFWRTY